MKRLICLLLCLFGLLIPSITAFASDSSSVAITVVIPQSESVQDSTAPRPLSKLPSQYLYPVSVWETNDNGRREIIKTYELGAGERPEDIPRESFNRTGYLYELTDIVKRETASADVQEHIETVTLDTDTRDTDAVIRLLAPALEYRSDDDYIGVLTLDISSIKVESAGTRTSNYTVTATREYPNLSNNDSSLVPKTITDNGKTLSLENIEWKSTTSQTVDYAQLPTSYTAVAKYTGTASRTTTIGYTTTAEYRGTISKILTGKTVYTAYYLGVPIVTSAVNVTPNAVPETSAGTVVTQNQTGTVIEPIAPVDPAETETTPEPETPTAEPEPEAEPTPEPDVTETPISNTEPEQKPRNIFLVIFTGLCVGGGLGGSFVYFCLQKNKKKEVLTPEKEEDLPYDEATI